MKGYIYCWNNKITNKYYIGKTYNKECRYNWFIDWNIHYAGPLIDKARKKYNDLKYWEYSILYEYENDDRSILRKKIDEMEIYYISLYNSNHRDNGYNLSSGGTWGDTYASLTPEERHARISKMLETKKLNEKRAMNNGIETIWVAKNEHQDYLDKGYIFGYGSKLKSIIKEAVIKYYNSDKFKEKHEQKLIEIEKRKEQRKYEHYKEIELRNKSKEWQDHLLSLSEIHRQTIIKYNKSEEHRKAARESNLRRWKDGVPEKTLQKMKDSAKNNWDKRRGKVIWIHNNIETKMINISDLDKYITLGYSKGRK